MNPEEQDKKPPLEQTLKPVKSLRTYQGDVQEAISKNNYSSSDIFLAEQERKKDSSKLNFTAIDTINPELKNKLFVTLGIIFFVLGISMVGIVYYLRASEKVIVEQQTKAIIGFSEESLLSVATTTREKFLNEILVEKESFRLPVNSVLYVNTINNLEQPENIEKIISLLAPRMPAALSRSFGKKYMIGIYSFDTNEPFIILSTEDFALSFSGMLKWEKDITSDLGKIFGINLNASSTVPTFVDEEKRNKDLRILKDADGKTLMLYSFIDSKTLLITKNENIFSAVLSKFLLSQQ